MRKQPKRKSKTKRAPRGFAAMSKAKQLEICTKGGKAVAKQRGKRYLSDLGRKGASIAWSRRRKNGQRSVLGCKI